MTPRMQGTAVPGCDTLDARTHQTHLGEVVLAEGDSRLEAGTQDRPLRGEGHLQFLGMGREAKPERKGKKYEGSEG